MTVLDHDPEARLRAEAAMDDIAAQLAALRRYVRIHVCGRDGFSGLLAPLGDVLDEIAVAVDEAAVAWSDRWGQVADEVLVQGRALAESDARVAETMRRIGAAL